MIYILRTKIANVIYGTEKIHVVREELQLLILQILHDLGSLVEFVFRGEAALRILHDIDRYSEDLDFIGIPGEELAFDKLNEGINRFWSFEDLKTFQ